VILSRAYGDPELLAIAFDNLVANAWKFSSRNPQPRIELSVSYRRRTL